MSWFMGAPSSLGAGAGSRTTALRSVGAGETSLLESGVSVPADAQLIVSDARMTNDDLMFLPVFGMRGSLYLCREVSSRGLRYVGAQSSGAHSSGAAFRRSGS